MSGLGELFEPAVYLLCQQKQRAACSPVILNTAFLSRLMPLTSPEGEKNKTNLDVVRHPGKKKEKKKVDLINLICAGHRPKGR